MSLMQICDELNELRREFKMLSFVCLFQPREVVDDTNQELIEIIRRDALADLSVQDKELLWKLRYTCAFNVI